MEFLFNSSQVYKDTYKFYQYNDNNIRVVHMKACRQKGFEEVKEKTTTSHEEVERISISRTRRNIRELALCNNFEFFATLTINSKYCDRLHLDSCQEKLREILKAIKRKNKDFAYIFITERHKDGAFHFHGLIKGLNDFYKNDNGYFSQHDFDKLGFNSFSKIKDYTRTCNYILKYITKDCVKNSAGTVYISSRGLKKADSYEIQPISCYWDYENDYCQIKDFKIDEMSQSDILQFYNIDEKLLTIKNLYNKIIHKIS